MKLSIVIPAYNEAQSLPETLTSIHQRLSKEQIAFSILVVNDNSSDDTISTLQKLAESLENLKYVTNNGPNGFGYAIRFGLNIFEGDCVGIMMADMSDSPDDLVKFYEKMKREELDCVFGDRWCAQGQVIDYPLVKKIVNRIANLIIRICFGIKYGDVTNAFKLYKKETIEGLKPFLSPHFNLTIELPLKAIIRGYSYGVVPNSWSNRKFGKSKLKLREMGSRYLFILMYCLIEKYFSKGDFKKKW